MANAAPTETAKKTTKTTEGVVFEIPIKVTSEGITLSLPKSAADFLGLDLEEEKLSTFAVPISGVIQLIGNQPKIVIPPTDLNSFINNK